MEIKINKEIRNYTESIFFGLSMRQFIFSICAVAVSVAVYFIFGSRLGTEITSWLCIATAAPFALLAFFKYNGMTAEKFVWNWIKSELLMPKRLVFRSTNTYYEIMRPSIEKREKEGMRKNDEITDKPAKARKRSLRST